MNADCIVAVDVGNSAVKLAVQSDDLIIDHSIRIGSSGWELSVIGWVRDHLGCRDTHWRIASVHRPAALQLEAAIRKPDQGATIQQIYHQDVPMKIEVDQPDRLGIDRLLSAYAASNLVDAPLVVIDAGSAVTVDWVNQAGDFCGGAILPGLGLQSRALVMGTDALPEVEWSAGQSLSLPAKNTSDAIRGGIVIGMSASIDGLVDRYCEAAEVSLDKAHVVMTGGDAVTLSPHLRHPHEVRCNLVCRGLLDLPSP
ncbi:MAG: type III pantothenate kinase [Rubripirellula sp.]